MADASQLNLRHVPPFMASVGLVTLIWSVTTDEGCAIRYHAYSMKGETMGMITIQQAAYVFAAILGLLAFGLLWQKVSK